MPLQRSPSAHTRTSLGQPSGSSFSTRPLLFGAVPLSLPCAGWLHDCSPWSPPPQSACSHPRARWEWCFLHPISLLFFQGNPSDATQASLQYVTWNPCSPWGLTSATPAIKFVLLEGQTKRSKLREPYGKLSPEEAAGFFGVVFFTAAYSNRIPLTACRRLVTPWRC